MRKCSCLRSRGLSVVGSGGIMERMGFTKRHMGVLTGVAAYLALGSGVIIHAPEIVAVGHGSEGAVQRKDLQAVAGKIELADDFRAEKGGNVGGFGKKKAGDDLCGDGGAAQDVAAFEGENLFARLGEIGGVYQSIVASADDND